MLSHDGLASLTALSVVLDLANGLSEDKSVLTATLAVELGRALGASEKERADVFLAALLRHLGCTSFAHREAELVVDDIALRRAFATTDNTVPRQLVRALTDASGGGFVSAGRAIARVIFDTDTRLAWTREACGGARALATEMGLGSGVLGALDEVFERHDGKGGPRGLAGREISLVGRVARVAHATVAHALHTGDEIEMLEHEITSPGALDPEVARCARDLAPAFLTRARVDAALAVAELEPMLVAHAAMPGVESIAAAFGDFADLQSAWTRGHSRAVAELVELGGPVLGLSAEETKRACLAAQLHDIGCAAVPTRIWEKRGALVATERTRAETHAYFTERVLSLAPPLSDVARIAGGHHERLDGSGYPRGVSEPAIGVATRLLAAADVFDALLHARGHRAPFARAEARAAMDRMASDGLLDPRAVRAVCETRRGQRTRPGPDGLAALTRREREVLALLATGRTNKEIGSALGISARTVQSHTVSMYSKLNVDTRAGAALIAARAGLLEPEA